MAPPGQQVVDERPRIDHPIGGHTAARRREVVEPYLAALVDGTVDQCADRGGSHGLLDTVGQRRLTAAGGDLQILDQRQSGLAQGPDDRGG
jgi:hypothetical protein